MRKPDNGLVHHSDQVSQYACHEHRNCLDAYGRIPSMNRKGDCWDNSPTERIFRSLKSEQLSDYVFTTKKAAKVQVTDYIVYYN